MTDMTNDDGLTDEDWTKDSGGWDVLTLSGVLKKMGGARHDWYPSGEDIGLLYQEVIRLRAVEAEHRRDLPTSLDEAMEIADGDLNERHRAAPILHTAVYSLRRKLAEISGIASTRIGTLAAQVMTAEDKLARAEQHLRMIRALADAELGEPLSGERHGG